jgi:hypothetical protein
MLWTEVDPLLSTILKASTKSNYLDADVVLHLDLNYRVFQVLESFGLCLISVATSVASAVACRHQSVTSAFNLSRGDRANNVDVEFVAWS